MKNIQTNKKETNVNDSVANSNKKTSNRKPVSDFCYYSKVLQKPFDTIEELTAAERTYFDKLRVKEDRAAQKKSDALQVENAFKTLNCARKSYKEGLVELTQQYTNDLAARKEAFENDKEKLHQLLASAEESYSNILKTFTEKYPEGYHLTLKDGDFETTISGSFETGKAAKADNSAIFNLFDLLLGL